MLKEPAIPYISNVSAQWITTTEAVNPAYWAGHVRQAVRFADGITELLKDPLNILLEVGPGQTLSTLARQHRAVTAGRTVLASFFAGKEQPLEACAMINTLGKLWLASASVDWPGFHGDEKRRRIPLPTYPFEKKRAFGSSLPLRLPLHQPPTQRPRRPCLFLRRKRTTQFLRLCKHTRRQRHHPQPGKIGF